MLKTKCYFFELLDSRLGEIILSACFQNLAVKTGGENEEENFKKEIKNIIKSEITFEGIERGKLVGLTGFNSNVFLSISEILDAAKERYLSPRGLGMFFHHCINTALVIYFNNLLFNTLQQDFFSFENTIGITTGYQAEKMLFGSLEIEYWKGEFGKRLIERSNWDLEENEYPYGTKNETIELMKRYPRLVYYPYTSGLEIKPYRVVILKDLQFRHF